MKWLVAGNPLLILVLMRKSVKRMWPITFLALRRANKPAWYISRGSIFLILIGCENFYAKASRDTKVQWDQAAHSLVGKDYTQILQCAGAPTQETKLDESTGMLSYLDEWTYNATQLIDTPIYSKCESDILVTTAE